MKKISLALLALLSLSITSCKDDDEPKKSTYPTDDITLTQKQNTLLVMSTPDVEGLKVGYDIPRDIITDKNSNVVSNISLYTNNGHPFYTSISSDINMNFGNPNGGSLIFNGVITPPDPFTISDDIADLVFSKPAISVAHAVTSNDTSWIVDVKLKFWRDTATPNFYIETYMLANVEARNYDSKDLRMGDIDNILANDDEKTFWLMNVPNIDSTANIINVKDVYTHKYVLMKNFNKDNTFGTPIAEYNPFGGDYDKFDILGTKNTPIRHHFPKRYLGAPKYSFTPKFVTVVWFKNEFEGNYTYVNSYSK